MRGSSGMHLGAVVCVASAACLPGQGLTGERCRSPVGRSLGSLACSFLGILEHRLPDHPVGVGSGSPLPKPVVVVHGEIRSQLAHVSGASAMLFSLSRVESERRKGW
jgi:hypothetical protein